MPIEILKDVLLLLLGGFVTFLFSLLIGRLQRQKPRMVWRTFPALHIAKEGLSGMSWLIENTGRKSAKNIRLTFLLPEKAKFTSFEIEPSETALEYTIQDSPDKPFLKSIIIPIFTQGVSLSISSLISGLGYDTVNLSIVGEDVVGSEERGFSQEDIEKRHRRFIKMYGAFYAVSTLMTIVFLGFMFLMMSNVMHYKNTEFIADLYVKAKDYDTAINIYETYRKNCLDFIVSDTVTYELAKLYALKGNTQKSVILLKQLDAKYFENRIEQDSSFDAIRSTPEFQDYLKMLKARKK